MKTITLRQQNTVETIDATFGAIEEQLENSFDGSFVLEFEGLRIGTWDTEWESEEKSDTIQDIQDCIW